jgi:hypothetical protein
MGSKSYSKGISWIDDCRIPFVDENIDFNQIQNQIGKENNFGGFDNKPVIKMMYKPQGRFPANLLVSDDMLNDGNIIQYNKNRTDNGTYLGGHRKEYVGTDDNDVVKQIKGQFFNDKGTNSRYYDIDKWFDNLIDV